MLLPPQEAQYETFKLPVTLPAVWGAKETDKLALCCGATVMGRLGPAKLNPVPEIVALESVTLCLPVLLTATGMITLLPTCTLPNATFDTESDIWAVAATGISNSEKRMRIQHAGLWGDPRQLMSFALFCTCSLSTAGDFGRAFAYIFF